ncbi:PDDEXK nuclease domain-containing protein [Armatimonas sp.]|uniref:PDDEXK nuclease domain-containing protein n=1 Tax=Armatimonas sp. TaxID=1872638 RepID=UPI00286A8E06|nr:PDDEXK nuclease domain-containing protein [Armatimonas sp.]
MSKDPTPTTPILAPEPLLADLRQLISAARESVARYVNQELTLLHWDIGHRIQTELLNNERAEYGKQIVATVSRQLTQEFGSGFNHRSVLHMIRFSESLPDREIVSTLSRLLSWSHFMEVIYLDDPLKRDFYIELSRINHWSVRTLRAKIQGMLFERSALSSNTDEFIKKEIAILRDEDRMTTDMVFRDPYLLPFLGLSDSYSEEQLEDAIIREMEAFLLEIGDGFTFAACQKKMPVGKKTYKLDLLLYHRKLRRLVAIELKIGPFKPDYKGQMELYLRWLDKNEREQHEEAPIGLILCSDAEPDEIELMGLDQGDIRVARYITQTLPPTVLEKKLREIVSRNSELIARREAMKQLESSGEE